MASAYIKDERGGTFIPASQRPDGTWRKPRRVKDGYIPQEEVPLYESKGKQIKNKPIYPVGASPEFIAEHKARQEALLAAKSKTVPGAAPDATKTEAKKKNKKKNSNKSKTTERITEELTRTTISGGEQKREAPTSQGDNRSRSKAENRVVANKTQNRVSPERSAETSGPQDPQKKLKNLRKKIREIEALEEKIKSGLLKSPEKDILDKLARKAEISREIARLEANQ